MEIDHDWLHDALARIGFAMPKNPGARVNGSDCLDTKWFALAEEPPQSWQSSTQHLLPYRDCGLCIRCWAQTRGDVFLFVEFAYHFVEVQMQLATMSSS